MAGADPLVLIPLLAGVACFAGFLVREATARAPMLPLSLFRVRNFAVANAATLTTYAGLMGSSFFLTLYLQQVAGYTALAAGFAGVPISLMLFFLSPRFGAFTARVGPRLPMSAGPIVGGVGLLLLLRVGVNPSYLTEVLPALIVFGLGLSATVAPLTTTVLNSVDEHNAGIASGVNNAVSRVAGLLAIAVLGAVISAHFATRLDDRVAGATLNGQAVKVVASAKSRPLAGGDEAKRLTGSERSTVGSAIEESSRDGFRLAVLISAMLMFAGGLTSALWIQNPRRKPTVEPQAPGAVTAGECARAARAPRPRARARGAGAGSPERRRPLCNSPPAMASKRIFSGIQPTGRKHLGNYIGAIRHYVEGQDRGEGIYCIVDLHAITVPQDPSELRERLHDTAAILIAAGLDPERCILFRQSDVKEHTELCWLLATVTAYGDLNRMHQFKEKSAQQRELVSAGLYFYPVLQAADVLAYRAHEVPVGDDQRQHIELMRDIAERFNARFGDVLVVPEGSYPEVGARLMNLQDPETRMSTTYGSEQGTVYILDDADAVRAKIRSAVTDSGAEVRHGPDKAGITNLIEILSVIRDVAPEEVEREFDGSGYGDFKSAVADAVVEYLAPIRERYAELRGRRGRPRGDAGVRRREGAGDRLRHARRRSRCHGHRAVAELAASRQLT